MKPDILTSAILSTRSTILRDLGDTSSMSLVDRSALRRRVMSVMEAVEHGTMTPLHAWQQFATIQDDIASSTRATNGEPS